MIRARTVILVLVLAAGPALAQEGAPASRPWDPRPDSYRSPSGHSPIGPDGKPLGAPGDRWRSVEAAAGNDTFLVGVQTPVFGRGQVSAGFFWGEEEDIAGDIKLMYYASPGNGGLSLGAGLGGYGAWPDEEDDPSVYAVTLSAAASYRFATALPFSIELDGSYAPDPMTFDDGNQLLDAMARVEVEVTSFAAVFVGYRYFWVELEPDEDDEYRVFDDAVHAGLRIAF
jgi:hypothetical protein